GPAGLLPPPWPGQRRASAHSAGERTRRTPHTASSMMSKKPEEYEDIPGTWVFDAERARKGYHLNAFLYSLMKAENREEFLADERKYLMKFPMTEEQREAVLKRDWNRLLELGGVSYALAKLAFTDKKSYQY